MKQVNRGWLEPLMARIAEDRHHVVMPIIESIGADDLQCVSSQRCFS